VLTIHYFHHKLISNAQTIVKIIIAHYSIIQLSPLGFFNFLNGAPPPRLCSDTLSARVSLVLSNAARNPTFYTVRNLVLQKDRLMSETEVLPPAALPGAGKTVGVLALQGGVAEHARMLESLEAQVVLVKSAEQLANLDALVLPGGESSTIDRLTRIFGLRQPLIEAISGGLPTLGTCAGLIMLSTVIDDPAPGQQSLGVLDVSVGRNAFGSQVDSAQVHLPWLTPSGEEVVIDTAFIRAPIVTRAGEGVQVVAHHEGKIVGVRAGNIIGISFHPEVTGDTTVHEELLSLIR